MMILIATLIAIGTIVLYSTLLILDVRISNLVKRIMSIAFISSLFIFIYKLINNSELNTFLPASLTNSSGYQGEVFGGLITTFLVFLFFALFSPIMEISPKIFKYPEGHSFEGQLCIKSFNIGFFPLHEVRAYLTKVERQKAEKGKFNVNLYKLDITFSYIEAVPSWTSRNARQSGNMFAIIHRVKLTDDNAKYGNIEKILNDPDDHSFYRFTISYRSSIGGLRRVKSENYTLGAVREGVFCSGASFKIRD